MKSFVVSLLFAAVVLQGEEAAATRLQQHSTESGIFSKLIAEQEEGDSFQKEMEDAKERKRIQLAEAEKEHEQLVAEEEKEEAAQKEKDAKEAEEREEEKRKDDARKHHEQMLKELTDDSNVQIGGKKSNWAYDDS